MAVLQLFINKVAAIQSQKIASILNFFCIIVQKTTMSLSSILSMIFLNGFVFGGFAYFLYLAIHKESKNTP